MKLSKRSMVGIAVIAFVLISSAIVAYKLIGNASANSYGDMTSVSAEELAYANKHYALGEQYVYAGSRHAEWYSGGTSHLTNANGLYKALGTVGTENVKKYNGLPVEYRMNFLPYNGLNGDRFTLRLTADFTSFESISSSSVVIPESMIIRTTLKDGRSGERSFGQFSYYPWDDVNSGNITGNINIKPSDIAKIELLRRSADGKETEMVISQMISGELSAPSDFHQPIPQNLAYGMMSHYAFGLDGWAYEVEPLRQSTGGTSFDNPYYTEKVIKFSVRQLATSATNAGKYVQYSLQSKDVRDRGNNLIGSNLILNQWTGDKELSATDVSAKIDYINGNSETVNLDTYTQLGTNYRVSKKLSHASKDMAKVTLYKKSFDSTLTKPFLIVSREAFAGESTYRVANSLKTPYEQYGDIINISKNLASSVMPDKDFINNGPSGLAASISGKYKTLSKTPSVEVSQVEDATINYQISTLPNGLLTQVIVNTSLDIEGDYPATLEIPEKYVAVVVEKSGKQTELEMGKLLVEKKNALHTLATNFSVKYTDIKEVRLYRALTQGQSSLTNVVASMNALDGTVVSPVPVESPTPRPGVSSTVTATATAKPSPTPMPPAPTSTSYKATVAYKEPYLSPNGTCGSSSMLVSATGLTPYEQSWMYGSKQGFVLKTTDGKLLRILSSVWKDTGSGKYNMKIALGNLSDADLALKNVRIVAELRASMSLLPFTPGDVTLVKNQYLIMKNDISLKKAPTFAKLYIKDTTSDKTIGCISFLNFQ